VVHKRKISGTGAGEIGDCIVFVGNLILDFDYEKMSRVLKIPDEKFRHKVKKSIEENLSTIRRELGGKNAAKWNEEKLSDLMVQEFAKLIGPLTPVHKDKELVSCMKALEKVMLSDNRLYQKGKHHSKGIVRIRSGLELVHRVHKAPGGLIRAEFALEDKCFREVALSGDFFCFPKDVVHRLEAYLEGSPCDRLHSTLTKFYTEEQFELPEIAVEDWMQVLKI
jgi:lipoate-protein ligase A